jgi:ABC-type transport system involved in multi-copper enzyme maturation permease subunit
MYPFVVSGLSAGVRGRSFQAVFLLGMLLVGVAYLSAGFSPRHPRTVALDIGFSGIRFTLVLLHLFWVQELVAKEIERKTILHSLAYPVSRSSFVIGRYLAVVVLGSLATVVLGLSLLAAVAAASANYSQEFPVGLGTAFWVTLFGLLLDAAVVAAVGMAVATVSTVAIMPLAIGVAFAIGGKALGATTDYLAGGADGDAQLLTQFGPVISVVRQIVPDLSRLDWRNWALYGLPPDGADIALAVAMALAYIAGALAIGILVFSRREFS